jgi:uncharacterized protein YjbJ (UPF0337 family)
VSTHTIVEAIPMAGLGDKVVGKAEELKGKATGDKVEELKGKARQAVGEVKEKLDHAVVRAEDAVEKRRHDDPLAEDRPTTAEERPYR